MPDETRKDRFGAFTALRRHYHDTKRDHRPVPAILPLLVMTALTLWTYALLDPLAARMTNAWPAWLTTASRALTDLGKSDWILYWSAGIMAAGYVIHRLTWLSSRSRMAVAAIQIAFYVFVSVALSGIIAVIVKRAVGRPRPEMSGDYGIFTVNPFMNKSEFESFPSGHATTDGAFFAALALLYPPLRWYFLAFGFVLALTRVFVSAHYPSDVLAGYGLGVWFAFLMAVLFARHGIVFTHKDGRLAKL
ncbi:phosphatase PAP2 family protein [Rhizobium sp.]